MILCCVHVYAPLPRSCKAQPGPQNWKMKMSKISTNEQSYGLRNRHSQKNTQRMWLPAACTNVDHVDWHFSCHMVLPCSIFIDFLWLVYNFDHRYNQPIRSILMSWCKHLFVQQNYSSLCILFPWSMVSSIDHVFTKWILKTTQGN